MPHSRDGWLRERRLTGVYALETGFPRRFVTAGPFLFALFVDFGNVSRRCTLVMPRLPELFRVERLAHRG